MEIDVTDYVEGIDCSLFSDSIHNSGLKNIGEITWRNALAHVVENSLVTPEQQDELRSWILEWGAWSQEEIAKMTNQETNALLLQFIAGDVREMEHFDSYEDYLEASENGQCSGRLCKNDNGVWWYYIGS